MLIKYICIIVSICFVIPVKAGIHFFLLDSHFRGNDMQKPWRNLKGIKIIS